MVSMRYKLDRQFFIPKDAVILKQNEHGIVYSNTSRTGKPHAIAFKGKAQKPAWNYIFNSHEHLNTYVEEWFNNLKAHEEFKADYRKRKQDAAYYAANAAATAAYHAAYYAANYAAKKGINILSIIKEDINA